MDAAAEDHRRLDGLIGRPAPEPADALATIEAILIRRRTFGITRLGAVTGLDRIGIPVVQVTRPASRSVAVSQGKGLTYQQAAMSGLMEALEGWGSERIVPSRLRQADLASTDGDGMWSHLLDRPGASETVPLAWIEGWDMIAGQPRPVPAALVDTDYILPSPHPHWLDRNTTGLAANTSLKAAIAHACCEILERDAHAAAMRTPHYFDRYQVGTDTIKTGRASEIIERLASLGFATGVWALPSSGHGLPAYWCHVMEGAGAVPFAPLPASGMACGASHDEALTKALLEACQSRLGAIAAAREDVTGSFYAPTRAGELSAWRRDLCRQGTPYPGAEPNPSGNDILETALAGLVAAGARAVIVVILVSEDSIPLHVVRVVAPPLESNADG